MSESEIARLRRNIAAEYSAAKWGLSGLRYGTTMHQFITAKMERVEVYHKELQAHVGDQAIQLVAETLEQLPEHVTRAGTLDVLRCELGEKEEAERLIDWIQDMWKTIDLLVQRFGQEDAHKIIHAVLSSSPVTQA